MEPSKLLSVQFTFRPYSINFIKSDKSVLRNNRADICKVLSLIHKKQLEYWAATVMAGRAADSTFIELQKII